MSALHDKPRGLLRVTVPPAFGAYKLSQVLPGFMNQYPDVQVDMKLTGDLLDLYDNKIDVAIRLTHVPPEDRVAKRLAIFNKWFVPEKVIKKSLVGRNLSMIA